MRRRFDSRRCRKLSIRVERLRRRAVTALEVTLTRARSREHTFLVVVAIGLGLLGAYGAIAFRFLIRTAHELFFGTELYSLTVLEGLPWWQRLTMPTLGGLLVGLVVWRLAPEVRGSGIPEVMEAVARRGGAIRARVVLTKAIAASLTIGSGGSAGREGPIVHIGAAIGSAVGRVLQASAQRRRTLVACGAAAGIAATFNAPIAGALFSMEVVLADLRVASFSPIVISSVVATVVSRHHLGDFPAFRVPSYERVSIGELGLYAGLGIAAALVSLAFVRLLYALGDRFDRSSLPLWLRPAVGGLGVGLIGLALPHVFGVGYETINAALWGGAGIGVLLAALAGKVVATSLTLGSGGSGGVFAPSLFLGATLGSSFGQLAQGFFPEWTAGASAYALVGMGAVVSATTHAPITAILIVFELTNDYRIIAPLMLSCVIAVLLSARLQGESVYSESLRRRGIRVGEARDVNLLRSLEVAEVMDHSVQAVGAELPLGDVLTALLSGSRPSAVVVDREGRYLGSVDLADVREVLPDTQELAHIVVAADVADHTTPFTVPGDRLDWVMTLFGRTHRDELPVCDGTSRRAVIGVVSKRAVIDAYNRRLFQADLAGGFHSVMDAVHGGRTVEVLTGVHLAEVEVPTSWLNKTLRRAEPRRRHGVEVVLVRRTRSIGDEPDEPAALFPAPDLVFQHGDRVLVMGEQEAIRRLRV